MKQVKTLYNRGSENHSSIRVNTQARPKKWKVSFDLDPKGRKQIDVSELQRVYEHLKTQNGSQLSTDDSAEQSAFVNRNHQNLLLVENDSHQNPSTNGSGPRQNPPMTENDSQKVIELLEEQVQDLKERLEKADTEKSCLLELANNLQKQNELLILPSPRQKPSFWGYLRWKR